jgi:hypothetical protein
MPARAVAGHNHRLAFQRPRQSLDRAREAVERATELRPLPRQKAGSFNLDQVMEKLTTSGGQD